MRLRELRYKSLPVTLLVFLLMGGVLFTERSGIKNKSTVMETAYIQEKVATAKEVASELPISCLVLTDSTQESSMLAMKQFEQIFLDMKIGYQAVDIASEAVPEYSNYETVVVLISDIASLDKKLLELCQWVKEGGRTMFGLTIQKSGYSDMIEHKLGILSSGNKRAEVYSVYPEAGFMIGGGKEFPIIDGYESAWAVELEESVSVHAYTADEKKTPIVWEKAYGDGKFVVMNLGICEKATRGFYAASYSLMEDICAYPVINASVFFLDDFPAPVPGGRGKYIDRDYHMDTLEFYKNVWWPDMLALSNKYGVKYTGLIIENYEDDVSGKVLHNKEKAEFQYFGNMLLRYGGELGYHGYNHQPLGYKDIVYGEALPYKVWESHDAMKNSVEGLIAFGKEQFPRADMSVYVPPSNIIFPEGRKMLGEEIPEIKTVASLYFEDEFTKMQEFEVADDNVIEFPRVISGCIMDDYMKMAALSEVNMHFVNSHFFHPDDVLDEERGAKEGWKKNVEELDSFMEWLYQSAPGIRSLTGSEAAGAVQRFSSVTAEKKISEDSMELNLNHLYDEAWFMLRFNGGKPGKVTGGKLEHVTGNMYLLQATQAHVTIERVRE